MNKKTSIKKDKNHIKIKKYIKNISKGLHKIYISANGKVKVRFLDKYISDPIKINKHTKKDKSYWKFHKESDKSSALLIRGTDHSDAYINSMYLIKTAIEKGNLPVLYIKGSDMCDKTIRQLEYFTKGVIFVSNIEMFNNDKNNHRWEPLLADRNKKLLLIVTNGNVVVRGR